MRSSSRSPKRARVGVVGLGMGRAHLRGYQSTLNCDIVAVCDLDRTRLESAEQEFGVPYTFEKYEEMFAMKELDAVSIALPNYLHAPATIAAAKAGKHVLCEKPMAMTVDQAQAMIAAAEEAGVKLMMHFNFRFTPQARMMKHYVDSGELGDIYYVKTGWLRRRGVPGMGSWFTQKAMAGGGPLIDLGVHRLDLALWLLGHPKPKMVLGSTYTEFGDKMAKAAKKAYDVEDLACGLIKLENGATVFLEASWAGNSERAEEMYTQLFGSKGGAEQRNIGEGYEFGLKVFKERGGAFEDILPRHFPTGENPQQHFVRCIQENKPVMAPGQHGLHVQQILNALYRSAETGEAVAIEE
ncbi:MAG: Gfo/Idh/MocA family oxidoreductase [Armatimonadetes bacterium]|nr:Gfo/Idh/MocA family oxidoreductase [Armatimonadota bacterium]